MRLLIKNNVDRERFIDFIKQVKIDKPYVASFSAHRKKRSLNQNRLLFMWLNCIKDDTGNSTDSLYQYFCDRYLPWNGEIVFGKEVHAKGGSSKLNTKQFTDFLDCIHQEMSEFGIYLPYPDDVGYEELYLKYGDAK